ncbi:hypothetical protein ACFL4T_05900 [candidate division KSB1 bacterium]
MSACPEWKFDSVTKPVFDRLKEKLKKSAGINIQDNCGTVPFSTNGLSGKIKYDWDESSTILSITVLEIDPPFIPHVMIKGVLDKTITECR